METALANIVNSPKLRIYSEEIDNILIKEQKRRKEFYETMKEGDKVEFINGEIVFKSPVKFEHNKTAALLFRLLSTYVSSKNLGYTGIEKIMISLTRNDYEPDICYFNKSVSDKFEPNQMQFPAPDFAAEVLSPSSEHNDRVIKFEDYAAPKPQNPKISIISARLISLKFYSDKKKEKKWS
jgi:Uma2 family endonuclease